VLNSFFFIYFESKRPCFFLRRNARLFLHTDNRTAVWASEADINKLVPFIHSGQLGLGPKVILERRKLIPELYSVIYGGVT